MSTEHNPIAQRISRLQRKWIETVPGRPEARIVRWKLKEEESKLFDGFCKLESTPHGALHEVVVVMFTPFKDGDAYAAALVADWSAQFEKERGSIPGFDWECKGFEERASLAGCADGILLEMLASFQQAMLPAGRELVVGLVPLQMDDSKAMEKWLACILAMGLPEKCRLMLLDYQGSPRFERFFKDHPKEALTLEVNLDLAGAIDQLVRAGDPNAPDVQFRTCMAEMSKAVNQGSEAGLDKWGARLLETSQKSGIRSMFASAHLIYAGMLFHFKNDKRIHELLEAGHRIAKQGLSSNDPAFPPVYSQICAFTAANHQLNKRNKDAVRWYLEQAVFCVGNGFVPQAVPAYAQALELLRDSDRTGFEAQLQKAIDLGPGLTDADLQVSNYVYLADDYCAIAAKKREWQPMAETLDARMRAVFGQEWRADVQGRRKEYAKKSPHLQIS